MQFTYNFSSNTFKKNLKKKKKLLTTTSCCRGWSDMAGRAVLVVGTQGTTAMGAVVDDVVGVVVVATPALALLAKLRR